MNESNDNQLSQESVSAGDIAQEAAARRAARAARRAESEGSNIPQATPGQGQAELVSAQQAFPQTMAGADSAPTDSQPHRALPAQEDAANLPFQERVHLETSSILAEAEANRTDIDVLTNLEERLIKMTDNYLEISEIVAALLDVNRKLNDLKLPPETASTVADIRTKMDALASDGDISEEPSYQEVLSDIENISNEEVRRALRDELYRRTSIVNWEHEQQRRVELSYRIAKILSEHPFTDPEAYPLLVAALGNELGLSEWEDFRFYLPEPWCWNICRRILVNQAVRHQTITEEKFNQLMVEWGITDPRLVSNLYTEYERTNTTVKGVLPKAWEGDSDRVLTSLNILRLFQLRSTVELNENEEEALREDIQDSVGWGRNEYSIAGDENTTIDQLKETLTAIIKEAYENVEPTKAAAIAKRWQDKGAWERLHLTPAEIAEVVDSIRTRMEASLGGVVPTGAGLESAINSLDSEIYDLLRANTVDTAVVDRSRKILQDLLALRDLENVASANQTAEAEPAQSNTTSSPQVGLGHGSSLGSTALGSNPAATRQAAAEQPQSNTPTTETAATSPTLDQIREEITAAATPEQRSLAFRHLISYKHDPESEASYYAAWYNLDRNLTDARSSPANSAAINEAREYIRRMGQSRDSYNQALALITRLPAERIDLETRASLINEATHLYRALTAGLGLTFSSAERAAAEAESPPNFEHIPSEIPSLAPPPPDYGEQLVSRLSQAQTLSQLNRLYLEAKPFLGQLDRATRSKIFAELDERKRQLRIEAAAATTAPASPQPPAQPAPLPAPTEARPNPTTTRPQAAAPRATAAPFRLPGIPELKGPPAAGSAEAQPVVRKLEPTERVNLMLDAIGQATRELKSQGLTDPSGVEVLLQMAQRLEQPGSPVSEALAKAKDQRARANAVLEAFTKALLEVSMKDVGAATRVIQQIRTNPDYAFLAPFYPQL